MSEQTLIYVYHDGGVGVYMKPDGDLVWKVAGEWQLVPLHVEDVVRAYLRREARQQ